MKTIKSSLLIPYTNLVHAFTTRINGDSLFGNNLAYHVNDKNKDVNKNHNRLAVHLDYQLQNLVHMNQVHGDKSIIIDSFYEAGGIPTCDAVITKEKNTPLMVMVADCIPVLIFDPVQEVIAAIHAGRAGIFSEILPKSIIKMQKEYGCKPKDLLISIGPSIHQCCYEVGSEIKEEAINYGYKYAIRSDGNKHFLNLVSIAHQQLKDCGIEKAHIEDSHYCTACNTDLFYSYRAEKSNCGRFAGVIMLK